MMEQLIQSSDLFVMQVEMDVYTALKKVRGEMTFPDTRSVSPDLFLTTTFESSLSAVDVSAAQSVVGRPHQAAPG